MLNMKFGIFDELQRLARSMSGTLKIDFDPISFDTSLQHLPSEKLHAMTTAKSASTH